MKNIKEIQSWLDNLLRDALNKANPVDGIAYFDGARLFIKAEASDAELRKAFEQTIILAAKGDSKRVEEAMHFVDLNLDPNINIWRPEKIADKVKLKQRMKKLIGLAKIKLRRRPKAAAEKKKSAIKISREKKRFYAALDFLFPTKLQQESWTETDATYQKAIKDGKDHRESVELALKLAPIGKEPYDKALDIAFPKMKKWLKGLIISLSVIAGIALIIVAIKLWPTPQEKPAVVVETTATETTAPETTPVTVAETTAGNPKFLQVKGNNANNRVDADFEKKYAEATQNATNLSDAQRKLLLDNSANNAFRLAIWSHAFGLYDDPNNWEPLVEGDYLSAEGEALYYKFEGAISAKGVIISKEKADEKGVNSGVSDGTYGTSSTSGITGNTDSIKVTLTDGSSTSILIRCGNVVNDDKDLPPVKTDEPPHKHLKEKSSNPDDYKQPGDGTETDSGIGEKPIVPVVTTPAESEPAEVVTEEVVNGVTETPTNDPGSESGVVAPGATETPVTVPPTTTEPGVNPPGDGTNTGDPGVPNW